MLPKSKLVHSVASGSSSSITIRPIDDLSLPAWFIEDAKAVRAHPAFQQALRLYAELVTENFQKTPLLPRIMSEEARFVLCTALMAMHYSRNPHDPTSGPTLTRLQAFAARFGLTGATRVGALVMLMKHAGYIEQRPAPFDRRVKRFEPTPLGFEVAERSTVATLKPLQLLSGAHDFLQIMREDPEFVGRYFCEGLRLYYGGVHTIEALPECDLFQTQIAGREVMFKLWIALTDMGPAKPGVVACSYEYLAQCFGVSRGHIRRMIEKGEQRGLFIVRARGGQAIEILPGFIDLNETLTALELATWLHAANAAASTTGRAEAVFW